MGVDLRMFVENRGQPLTKEDMARLSERLVSATGGEDQWFCYEEKPVIGDDVFPIPKNAGKFWQLLEVYVLGRHFTMEDPSRGPLWHAIAVAEWLEANIHRGHVFIATDFAEDEMVPFDAMRRREYIDTWAKL